MSHHRPREFSDLAVVSLLGAFSPSLAIDFIFGDVIGDGGRGVVFLPIRSSNVVRAELMVKEEIKSILPISPENTAQKRAIGHQALRRQQVLSIEPAKG